MYNYADYEFRTKIPKPFESLTKSSKVHIKNVSPKPKILQCVRNKVAANVAAYQAARLNDAEKGRTDAKRKMALEELRHVIDTAMVFQQDIIELGKRVNHFTSLPLMFIFLQAVLKMIFNTYNMVVFLLRLAKDLEDRSYFGAWHAVLFYGYHIMCGAGDVLVTVIGFSMVYNMIESMSGVVCKLNLYVREESLRMRLLQFAALVNNNLRKYSIFGLFQLDGSFIFAIISGITTYIIILIQYGISDDVSQQSKVLPTQAAKSMLEK